MAFLIRQTRRGFLGTAAAFGAAGLPAFAQGAPIKLGALPPLTGAGGNVGPNMVKSIEAVIGQANKMGGILGRKVELVVEDDQSNPDAAVRAAQKLIEFDKVVAVLATFSSASAAAVAPLCWQSKTFMFTSGAANTITIQPHGGYIARTQANISLQGKKFGELTLQKGGKRVVLMSPQTPFAQDLFATITETVKPQGGETSLLIYDDKRPSYRTEMQEALRFKPDVIIMGGYLADTSVLLKDMYRAGFAGTRIAFGFAVNQQLVDSLQKEIGEGLYTLTPASVQGGKGYQELQALVGTASPDLYACQCYDQANLALLAMTHAQAVSGTAIKDSLRAVSQGDGTPVSSLPQGLEILAKGGKINYEGASGPCDFLPIGDIVDASFRCDQVKDGKLTFSSSL